MDLLVFPHQLFETHPGFELNPDRVVLIEDSLFFGDYRYPLRFHKQKLWFHRATMRRFQKRVDEVGFPTVYLSYQPEPDSLLAHLTTLCETQNDAKFVVAEPVDFILEKRLNICAAKLGAELQYLETPGFINSAVQNRTYRSKKKRWFMADFYRWQRTRLNILVNGSEPAGGKWSFDHENRKKVPKILLNEIPDLPKRRENPMDQEAKESVEQEFADNPGNLDRLIYPTSHAGARNWLGQFLEHRFERFGDYEDAIVQGESWLWHSVLTPMLNVGLLTPSEIIQSTLKYSEEHNVPLNSVEGFIRQVIGWREFIRATYQALGVEMRTKNYWGQHRKMPQCFYDATTGIPPIDDTIQRILDTGYCHHIERLMVLGGFMFLCEINPDEIYRWFMEMFVDSYDWVMVPNAYAMSQNADGGLITTKPYFSGSSYIRKMSHYKKGPWCDIWDGLYWRWIQLHALDLAKNPRWAMMCSMAQKMSPEKRDLHMKNANDFISSLDA